MRHFLNEVEIAPRNITEIGVINDFTDRPKELEINVDKLILPREALTIIQNHINTIGIFEGIPYRIELESGININYYVDLTESAIFRDYEIEVKIKRRNALDNFFDKANGSTFELMNSQGVIFNSFDTPYLIVKDNAAELGISLAITLFIMVKELIAAIRDLATAISDLIQAVTPNATLPPLPPLGAIIALVVTVVAQLVYTIVLLLAVIKLGQQLLELIFPKIRYFLACKVKELLLKGSQFLGYTFQSTLLDALPGLTILPVPLRKKNGSFFDFLQNDLNFAFNKGYPTASDSTPTLGSLFTAIEDQLNARTKVINGVVYLERRDFWQNMAASAILPALVLQDKRTDEYTLNTAEAWKRYYIHYAVDFEDVHTVDDFDSTDAEYSTEPLNVINADLVTIKGLQEVNIPFALGKRKDKLNWIENVAKGVFDVIDELINFLGGNSSLGSLIENRIGSTQIGAQYFGVTKMLYTVNGKQPANYKDFIRASRLWANYHYINQIQINGYLIKESARTKISNLDFVNLQINNFAEINGVPAEILRIEFIDAKSYAIISYKELNNYALGKVQTITINE